MSQVEFFKATSKGGIDPIDNSSSSLHSRRSILIKDDVNTTLWLIHGSTVSKKTHDSAVKNAEKINKENHGAYDIVEIEYSQASDKIDEILSAGKAKSNKTGKKVSLTSIPSVPVIKKVKEPSNQPLGDTKHDGPEIEEFQISYYLEKDPDIDQSNPNIQAIFNIISDMEHEVKIILDKKPSKTKSQKKLREMVDNIINLIY